jgi:hypothetical protein
MNDRTLLAADVPVEAKARRWTLRVIAQLLVVQAMLLIGICAVVISRIDWDQELEDLMLSLAALDTILLVALLGPLAVFELVAALGMWLGGRGAWLRAMIIQGILLIFCLSSYVAQRRETFIYLLMLTCIIIVLYLNTNDVRLAHQNRPSQH